MKCGTFETVDLRACKRFKTSTLIPIPKAESKRLQFVSSMIRTIFKHMEEPR
jgi:hypothetical protein